MAVAAPLGPPVPTVPPRASFARSLAAAFEHELLLYRRTWRGSLFGNFLTPILFLVAMGIGLGSYVDDSAAGTLGGVTYLQFLAPGLLAATLMQTASFESAFPVIGGFNWQRRYHAMHASPLTPGAIALGHLLWVAARLTIVGTAFTIVMTVFGAAASPLVALAIPAAVLTGLAFAGPLTAVMATQRNPDKFFYFFRFGVTPMFLFSGTFFPIEQLPTFLQPLAWATPLWHGVDLCRALALGTAGEAPLLMAVHVAFLATFAGVGAVLAVDQYRKRLER